MISRLLDNSSHSAKKNGTLPSTPPRVRASALRCLELLPTKFRADIVLPYRRQVVKKLTAALDDGKREVRSAAVKCRNAWLLVDEVDNDD